MGSKKKDKKPKAPKKRSKKELLAALRIAEGKLTLALEARGREASRSEELEFDIEERRAKLIPAKAIAEAIRRDCPPGTRCNALVNVIYYPCGTSKVVPTQRDWWLSLLEAT